MKSLETQHSLKSNLITVTGHAERTTMDQKQSELQRCIYDLVIERESHFEHCLLSIDVANLILCL